MRQGVRAAGVAALVMVGVAASVTAAAGAPAVVLRGTTAPAVGAQSAPAPETSAHVSRTMAVTGFQSESDPLSRIDRSASALHTVGVDGVSLDLSGAGVPAPDAAAQRQKVRAHRDHLHAVFLVSNYDDAIDDFSEAVAWRLLSSSSHRAAVAAQLGRDVRRQGWDGVNVDLESLSRRDGPGLVDLLRRIRAALPAHRTLTLDLMAATDRADYPAMGYESGRSRASSTGWR